MERLKKNTYELDEAAGTLMVNSKTIESVKLELGRMATEVENTGHDMTSMGMTLHDIRNRISLLSDLLNYTSTDMKGNIKNLDSITENFYAVVIRGSDDNVKLEKKKLIDWEEVATGNAE